MTEASQGETLFGFLMVVGHIVIILIHMCKLEYNRIMLQSATALAYGVSTLLVTIATDKVSYAPSPRYTVHFLLPLYQSTQKYQLVNISALKLIDTSSYFS